MLDEDQELWDTLLQHNRLLRKTNQQMKDGLEALRHTLQQKQRRRTNTDHGCRRSNEPPWVVQDNPLDVNALRATNSRLHRMNRTLAQLQMTLFKKLVDITRVERRPEKHVQTRNEERRGRGLQQKKEQLQAELEWLELENGAAARRERLLRMQTQILTFCVRVMELCSNRRRHLILQVEENQVLEEQVRRLEEELQRRRSAVPWWARRRQV